MEDPELDQSAIVKGRDYTAPAEATEPYDGFSELCRNLGEEPIRRRGFRSV